MAMLYSEPNFLKQKVSGFNIFLIGLHFLGGGERRLRECS